MKNYRYYLSLTSQFYFCGIPFRLDTTPKCDLNCLYCFAMARGGRRTDNLMIATPKKLETLFRSIDSNTGLNSQLIKSKLPIHFGGMSDPFSNELSTNISLQLLDILKTHDYPVVLSTKNTNILTSKRVFDKLLEFKSLAIQISIPVFNHSLSKKIEPLVPSPSLRIEAINELIANKINVIVRIQPIIPFLIDDIHKNLIPKLISAKVNHIIFEFLKLPVEQNISLISSLVNIFQENLYDFYKRKKAKLIGREWLLPVDLKYELLKPILFHLESSNISYSIADYGLYHLSKTDCCCGIDSLPEFKNFFKGNIPNIIKAAQGEKIHFSENYFSEFPNSSIRTILNSNSRNDNLNTVLEYIKKKWNSPGTINAPDSFYGIQWRGEKDESENCVYEKNIPILGY